jgi:hypothetical protein
MNESARSGRLLSSLRCTRFRSSNVQRLPPSALPPPSLREGGDKPNLLVIAKASHRRALILMIIAQNCCFAAFCALRNVGDSLPPPSLCEGGD